MTAAAGGVARPPRAAGGGDRVLWPVSAWFWALQFAVLNPVLAVLLVGLYGATDGQVGPALCAYNVGGFLASLLIPAAADRRGDYLRPLLLSGISGLGLVAALALAPALPFAVVALVLLGGPPGVGSTLLFAQLRHSGAPAERVVRTRAIVSFAWVVGPPLATATTAALDGRGTLGLLAVIAAVNVATAVLLLRDRWRSRTEATGTTYSALAALRQLRPGRTLVVVLVFVVLQTTNIATVTITGLFVTQRLHAPIVWAGAALGTAALLEIPALLLIGRLLDRWSARTLVLGGCAAGVVYYAAAALTTDPVVLVALQPLNAVFFAVVAGVGLTVFQETFAAPGLGAGLFTNTRRIGAILAGLLIGVSAIAPDTFTAVYLASAAATLLVLAITALTLGATTRPAPG
jgi:SET family sugar efflux transporter-like MFS transporter